MGCGKSSVGRRLSSLLSCSWADVDHVIEAETGRSVSELFQQEGEVAFRERESATLARIIAEKKRIISLGGGTPTIAACRELIRKKTVCIWLKASPETLTEHMQHSWRKRPLLKDMPDPEQEPEAWKEAMMERISSLLKKREPDYAAIARFTVDINGMGTDEVVAAIIRLLNESL